MVVNIWSVVENGLVCTHVYHCHGVCAASASVSFVVY